MDVFAGLLAHAGGDETVGAEITQSSTATINGIELKGTAREIIAALLQGGSAQGAKGADATPAEGQGTGLSGLADLLAKIEAALEAGEPVDPDLLDKLNQSIDALAAIIGGPVSADASLTAGLPVDDAAVAVKVAPAQGLPEADPEQPVLKGLADRLKDLADKLGDANGTLAQKLEALSEKLGALKATVADLFKEAPELKAVIEALAQPKAEAKAPVPVAPTLAPPELKLPRNASLSGEKAAATPPASTPEDGADGAEAADAPQLQVKPEVKADAKVEQPIAAAPSDKREAPSAPVPSQPAALADTTVTATSTAAAAAGVGTQSAVHGEVRAVQSAYQAPSPINLPHIAFEIVRQVQQGGSRFQIRLDPPELGRVDVSLDMDSSGQVNAKLTVERSETLDLLQRDQRALERALAQAGLDTSKTNLEFSLRQNPFAGQDGRGQQQGNSPFASGVPASAVAEVETSAAVTVYRGSASPGGVNIFV